MTASTTVLEIVRLKNGNETVSMIIGATLEKMEEVKAKRSYALRELARLSANPYSEISATSAQILLDSGLVFQVTTDKGKAVYYTPDAIANIVISALMDDPLCYELNDPIAS